MKRRRKKQKKINDRRSNDEFETPMSGMSMQPPFSSILKRVIKLNGPDSLPRSTIAAKSIHPLFGLDIGDLVGEREFVHRAIVEAQPCGCRNRRKPAVCFSQVSSLRLGKSSRACAPRLSSRASAPCTVTAACEIRLSNSSVSIKVGVPDQRAVGDVDVGECRPIPRGSPRRLPSTLSCAEHGAVALHGLLPCAGRKLGRGRAASA